MAVFGAYVLKWSLKQTSTLTEDDLCYMEGRPSEKMSLSPLVSLIKAYLEEKNIMKMGM